jgi:hypothetical protein
MNPHQTKSLFVNGRYRFESMIESGPGEKRAPFLYAKVTMIAVDPSTLERYQKNKAKAKTETKKKKPPKNAGDERNNIGQSSILLSAVAFAELLMRR